MSTRTDSTLLDAAQARPLRAWILPLIGVAAAAAGLVPWLVTGMRLPLQNLWATETLPEDMPIALLPFSQYALSLIAALLVTGAAAAGIAARALRARMPPGGVLATFAGLLATQVIAAAQTAVVVRNGLDPVRTAADLYFAGVLGVIVLSILVGALVFRLVAVAPRAGALVGLAIAAVAFGPWLNRLLIPFSSLPTDWQVAVVGMTRWVPAILVGAAIAWCGVGTVGRVVAAVASLALLWIGPALITGVTSAAGSRVLASSPADMLDYAVQVTRMALFLPEVALPPIALAVAVAIGGLVVRRWRARSTGGSVRRTPPVPPSP